MQYHVVTTSFVCLCRVQDCTEPVDRQVPCPSSHSCVSTRLWTSPNDVRPSTITQSLCGRGELKTNIVRRPSAAGMNDVCTETMSTTHTAVHSRASTFQWPPLVLLIAVISSAIHSALWLTEKTHKMFLASLPANPIDSDKIWYILSWVNLSYRNVNAF